jgi:protein SCO1/2
VSSAVQPLEPVRRFMEEGGFPAFGLALLAFYELLLVVLLLLPGGDTGLGAFAEDFRIWCFGYDPSTGRLSFGFLVAMLTPPFPIAAMLLTLWREPLRELCARPAALAAHVASAAGVVLAAAAAFAWLGATPAQGELPFPAEALRTAHRPPALELVDQAGEPVALGALRGRVVLLTAVYASCVHTCPAVLDQAKHAVAALSPEERAELDVVAVTLDPAHDTPEVLAGLAGMHGLDRPLYRLATGEPARVERVLVEMGVARARNPETGVIDHANLFLLLDREGAVAYRFTLGERQQRWLVSALRVLLAERPEARHAG